MGWISVAAIPYAFHFQYFTTFVRSQAEHFRLKLQVSHWYNSFGIAVGWVGHMHNIIKTIVLSL